MRTYTEVITELQDNGVVAVDGDYYDFEGFPLAEQFENFFLFGQEYLDRDDLDFSIEPARLYFNTSTDVNALARQSQAYYLVEINKGAIFWMYHFYTEKNNRFNQEPLRHFRDITNARGIDPGFFLFQLVSIYFFYHEVGHLIQRTESHIDYVEFINAQLSCDQVRIRHMRELDADWYSAHCMAMHVIQFSEVQTEEGTIVDNNILLEIASLALSALYTYYINQNIYHAAIYYEEHSHPHPSVRLSYMINFFLDNLQGNFANQLDKNAILRKAIQISELLMIEEDRNIIEEYSVILFGQLDNVEEYVNRIITNTNDYPTLCVHILNNEQRGQGREG